MEENRFEQIYNKLQQNGFLRVEYKRKKAYKSMNYSKLFKGILSLSVLAFDLLLLPAILFAVIISYVGYKNFYSDMDPTIKYLLLVFIISFLIVILGFVRSKVARYKKEQYIRSYILEFNKAFIKEINPNYSYDGNMGVLEKNYKLVDLFPYEDYQSRGLISGKMSNGYNFRVGQVTTWSSYKDQKERTVKFVKFDGIFYEIDLPFSINSKLYLRSDKKSENTNFIKKILNEDFQLTRLKINMDSAEFEDVFDVYAENRVLAMQIFTADVMLELKHLYSSTSNKFEVTINKDKLYIKFNTGAVFKVPGDLSIEVLNKDTLLRYFNKFECTLKLSEKLIKIIEENNIL